MSIIKKITFIRHGECVSNVQKVFQSIGDTLTDIGTQQAQSWGSILANEAFDQVYTSTAVRTLQTLTYAISQGLTLPSIYNSTPLMLEIDRGIYAGVIETMENRSELNRITNTLTEKPDGGESVMDVWNRVITFREHYLTQKFDHILLVGHSGWLKYLIAQLEGKTVQEALQMRSLGHQESCTIQLDETGNMLSINFTLH